MQNITKYMCTVETKNYPVNTIRPTIQRYSSIRKKLNASEIASCIAGYATVTLHKNNGANVKLNADNFKRVLLEYKNELLDQQFKTNMNAEIKNNTKAIEEMKKEEPVVTKKVKKEEPAVTKEVKKEEEPIVVAESESLEEFEADPEDPDTADWSPIYDEEDKKEN